MRAPYAKNIPVLRLNLRGGIFRIQSRDMS
jgi:hypothetical protein